jgi:hypothetical protein
MNKELKNYQSLAKDICETLKTPQTLDPAAIRQAFLARLSGFMKDQRGFFEGIETLEKKRDHIKYICERYCDLFEAYWEDSSKNSKKEKDYPEADMIKSKARAIAPAMRDEVVRFALCEFDMNKLAAVIAREMIQALGKADQKQKDVKWTFDLPEKIRQARTRQETLDKKTSIMSRAMPIIKKTDFVYITTEQYLCDLLSEPKGKIVYTEFMDHLRKMRYTKAYELIAPLHAKNVNRFFQRKKKEKKRKWNILLDIADVMGKLLKKISPALINPEGTLYLREKEFSEAFEQIKSNLTAAENFIAQNEVAEIRYRQEALKREFERFYTLATFEKYLETFEALVKGYVMPMKTMKDVRSYEVEIFKKAEIILYQNVSAIEQIFKKAIKMAKNETMPVEKSLSAA